jgi:hypothetical protein
MPAPPARSAIMSRRLARSIRDDEAFIDLAESLALGEVIPARLSTLWDQVGRDPEAMAQLEEQRQWCLLASAAAQAEPEADAMLVLRVHREGELRVEVGAVEGWLRQQLEVDTAGGVHARSVTGGTVRLRDLKVTVEQSGVDLLLRLHGDEVRIRGVSVESSSSGGDLLARAQTTAAGSARLGPSTSETARLTLRWPSPRRRELEQL